MRKTAMREAFEAAKIGPATSKRLVNKLLRAAQAHKGETTRPLRTYNPLTGRIGK